MIYVHVPFCKSFCTYCGFYSELCREGSFEKYTDAVCREASQRREEIIKSKNINTLYFGGGTPSVLPLNCIKRITEALPFDSHSYEEFTVEMNPDDVTEALVRGLMALGVNRISLGIQSFDDDILKWMNRRHDAAGAVRAVEILKKCGIGNISIDLIFGLPALEQDLWASTLDKALELKPQHISAYQLSIEEDSTLERMLQDGRFVEANQETCREQYDYLCKRMADSGYNHYEVSNFALPGFEAVHNSAYWARQPYVGLGPGAHSFDDSSADGLSVRSWNPEIGKEGVEREILSAEDVAAERLMLGLRTAAGLPSDVLESIVPPETLRQAITDGWLILAYDPLRYRIPESKFFVSDDIISSLLP